MKHMYLSVLWMIFLLSTAIVVALNFRPLYYHDMNALKIEETSGFSKEEIKENYNQLIDYNFILNRKPLKLTMPMSEEGRIHFEEVKRIFDIVQVIFLLSLAGVCYTLIKKKKQIGLDFILAGSILSILVPVFLGMLIFSNWENAFVGFHKLFFRNDYWIFSDVTDPVIKILPDTFFFHTSLLAIGFIIVASIVSMVVVGKRRQS